MAQYRDGAVTVTSQSSTVLGSGTQWTLSVEPGHWFTLRGQAITYTIAAVISDTEIRLSGAYQGPSQSGAFYLIHTDYTPRGYAVPGPGDVDATIIIRRAIYEIDADLTAILGSPDGSSRAIRVSDLLDLNTTTALTGHVMTRLADGTYGFSSLASLAATLVNLGQTTTNTGLVYAGTSPTGAHQFRGIQVIGGTIAQNADRLTITIPQSGVTNSLASVGSPQSLSIVAVPTGNILNTYGLRAGSNVTIIRDGTDIIISSTATGGGTGGDVSTGTNIGPVTTNVFRPYSDKAGAVFRFRTILFGTDDFLVSGEATGQYTVTARKPRLADLQTVDLASATANQVLQLQSDGVWRGLALPAPGLASVQADTAPRLGGTLTTAGNRIIGVADAISGMIERPLAKNYTLILRTNAPITITSMSAACTAGSVRFEVFLGIDLIDIPGSTAVAPLTGTIDDGGFADVVAVTPLQVPIGSRLTLRLNPLTATAADFSFSIAYASA